MFKLSVNQKGMSPLVILSLVVLGVFIIWEITQTLDRQFNQAITPVVASPNPSPANAVCNLPNPSDCFETGAGFDG